MPKRVRLPVVVPTRAPGTDLHHDSAAAEPATSEVPESPAFQWTHPATG